MLPISGMMPDSLPGSLRCVEPNVMGARCQNRVSREGARPGGAREWQHLATHRLATARTGIASAPGATWNKLKACPSRRLERLSARLASPLVRYLVGRLLVDFGPVVASCPSGRRKLFARQLRGPLS